VLTNIIKPVPLVSQIRLKAYKAQLRLILVSKLTATCTGIS